MLRITRNLVTFKMLSTVVVFSMPKKSNNKKQVYLHLQTYRVSQNTVSPLYPPRNKSKRISEIRTKFSV